MKQFLGQVEISGKQQFTCGNYYPFGMRMEGMSFTAQSLVDNGTENKYLYNGKELQDDLGLNWYAYEKRFYDPVLGRFPSIDPIIEEFPEHTPYNYAFNNPSTKIDLYGLQGIGFQFVQLLTKVKTHIHFARIDAKANSNTNTPVSKELRNKSALVRAIGKKSPNSKKAAEYGGNSMTVTGGVQVYGKARKLKLGPVKIGYGGKVGSISGEFSPSGKVSVNLTAASVNAEATNPSSLSPSASAFIASGTVDTEGGNEYEKVGGGLSLNSGNTSLNDNTEIGFEVSEGPVSVGVSVNPVNFLDYIIYSVQSVKDNIQNYFNEITNNSFNGQGNPHEKQN